MMRAFPHRPFRKVKAQSCLPHFWVWAMTAKTATRQDWLDVLIEIETVRNRQEHKDRRPQRPKRRPVPYIGAFYDLAG
jgi:hypothetical protein